MAKVEILNVDTSQAQKSVKGLRDEIKALRDALLNTEKGTEEYDRILKQLQDDQQQLDGVMKAGRSSATALAGSYDALVAEMAELKKQWRATADEGERSDLGKRILSINNQLKSLDASTGNFQRNVGDYKNAFISAFSGMGGAVGNATRAIQGTTVAAKALSATPLIAILGLLAILLNKIIGAFKSTEEGMEGLSRSSEAFAAIGNVLTGLFQGLTKAINAVVGAIGWVIEKLGLFRDAIDKQRAAVEAQIALTHRMREEMVAAAKDEMEVSELRAKAADKEKYTVEERVKYLNEALEIEKSRADEELKTAEMRLDLARKQSALTQNSKEANDELAAAEANLYKVRTDYNNRTRRMISQRATFEAEARKEEAEARKKEIEDYKAALKEREEAEKEAAREAERRRKAGIDAEVYQLNYRNSILEQEIRNVRKGSEEEARIREEILSNRKQIDVLQADKTIQDAQQLADQLLLIDAKYYNERQKLEEQTQAARLEQQNKELTFENETSKRRLSSLQKDSEEYLLLSEQIAENERQIRANQAAAQITDEQELANEMFLIWEDYYAQLRQIDEDNYNAMREEEILRRENEMEEMPENSMARLEAMVELKRYELDTLHQLEGESEQQFYARMLEAERAYNDAKKELARQRLSLITAGADAMAGLFNSLASMYESNSKDDEKNQKRAKNLQIAGATVQMLSGAVTAFATAQQLGPILGPIIGAINAAAVIAAGIANINKIKQTNVSKDAASSSSASAATSAPAAAATPVTVAQTPIYRSLTTASEEERLDRAAGDQRVYLVYSDVQAAGRTVEVQQSESGF